jgi:hypothetical protein
MERRMADPTWEMVQNLADWWTERLEVPGGWLYRVCAAKGPGIIGSWHVAFVPKPPGNAK